VTDLVFVGTGGQARELHAIVEALDGLWTPIGFLDDAPGLAGARVHGLPVLGDVGWLETHPTVAVAVGVGATSSRRRVVERIRSFGEREFPALVHPAASVGRRTELGEGVFVCPGAVLTTDITVGDHVLLNSGCTIGHDAVIEDFVTVAPGAHVSGAVRIGEGADIGTGASIIQGVAVGRWSVVGAGAAVTTDIPPNTTAVGVPARVIGEREPGRGSGAR
jgi:sugar O-acyltransferase (sialic acid O-acetyltransferase NeuD family)